MTFTNVCFYLIVFLFSVAIATIGIAQIMWIYSNPCGYTTILYQYIHILFSISTFCRNLRVYPHSFQYIHILQRSQNVDTLQLPVALQLPLALSSSLQLPLALSSSLQLSLTLSSSLQLSLSYLLLVYVRLYAIAYQSRQRLKEQLCKSVSPSVSLSVCHQYV